MNEFNFKSELKFILKSSILLDILAYLISILFLKFTISMALGLILGTLILILNLNLLNNSIYKAVKLGKSSSKAVMSGYLIRSVIIAVGLVIALKFDFINALGYILPLFYPKIIYTIHSIVKGGK